jgi:hypothetical protein
MDHHLYRTIQQEPALTIPVYLTLHGQNGANDLIERLKNKQNENGLKILKLRKLL